MGYKRGANAAGDPAHNMLENPGWYTAPPSTGNVAGPSGGAVELPDSGARSDLLRSASVSLLDEATAAAEAMALAKRASKAEGANRFFVADDVRPQTLDVVRTVLQPLVSR